MEWTGDQIFESLGTPINLHVARTLLVNLHAARILIYQIGSQVNQGNQPNRTKLIKCSQELINYSTNLSLEDNPRMHCSCSSFY